MSKTNPVLNMPNSKPGNQNKANNKASTRKEHRPKYRNSAYKITALFLCFLGAALFLGLLQAALVSKDAFISRVENYLNFANPTKRFVYLYPGMRREEMIAKYTKVLNWDEKDKMWFIASAPANPEGGGYYDGYFLSKSYIVDKDATGKEVGEMMYQEFNDAIAEKVLTSKNASSTKTIESNGKKRVINLDTAVRIASIIQREAAGKHDMNLISGVIWNRIFLGMSLDMDATLQYVKGSSDNWWPQVKSKDKYLESPYNTYQNKGVPPGAISNPSIDAINAAYNPQKTDCIFYLHDRKRKIHCEKTYAAHKRNVEIYLR